MKLQRKVSAGGLVNKGSDKRGHMYAAGLMLALCMGLLLVFVPKVTTAQESSPMPTASATETFPPPTVSPTPSNTPTPDATLGGFMVERQVINATNAAKIQAFYEWQGHSAGVTSLVFTGEGALVSTASNGTNQIPFVRMWQIQDANVNAVKSAFENSGSGQIPQIQISHDGQLLSAGYSGEAVVWDASSGRPIARIPQTWASTVAITGAHAFMVGGENGVVGLWAVELPYGYVDTGVIPEGFRFGLNSVQLITAFQVDEAVVQVGADPITSESFILTKSGMLKIFISGGDGRGRLTTAAQAIQAGVPAPLDGGGNMMVLRPDEKQIIYAGSHHDVIVYDYVQNQTIAHYQLAQSVSCISYSPHGNLLVIGDTSAQGVLHVLELDGYSLVTQLNTGGTLGACAINDNGTLMATGDSDGNLTLWGVS